MIAAHEPLLERNEAVALGEEALATLADEARLFEDSAFLAQLHADLKTRLDQQCAAATLLQVGFFHGLRDATRLLQQSVRSGTSMTAPRATLKLPMQFRACPSIKTSDTLEFHGDWPNAFEAEALRALPLVSEYPRCALSSGYTSGWLSGIHETEILALETECRVCESERCRFLARKVRDWRKGDDPRAAQLLGWLDFEMLRNYVTHSLAASTPQASLTQRNSPTVHVWGPVMVLPFGGGEESVRAIERIGANAEARQVTMIVVDCADALLDDGFGAVAIERILEAAKTHAAECILSGLSPRSESAVRTLRRNDFLVYHDLEQAIRAAFQIANFKGGAI